MSEAVPKSEEMTPIDLRFRDEVFYPWEEASHASQFPWEATPALRKTWKALLGSNDRLDREIGYLALSRCAKLSADEKETIAHFWDEGKDFQHISAAAALRLVLSGASPADNLFGIYFADLEPASVSSNPITKTLLSMLSRHPGLGQQAEEVFAKKVNMYYLGLAWGLNPLLSEETLLKLAEQPNPWYKAAALCNPALSFDKALKLADPQADLDFICLLLRAGLTPEQWEQINAHYLPDETFMFILVEHPAAQGKSPPPIDWANPSLEAIQYFSHQTYLGALWRWWGPLLTMPWLSDQLSEIAEPGVLLAFMLFGAPREIFIDSPALDHGLIRRYLNQHPAVLLENYYAKQAGAAGQNPAPESEAPPRA